MNAVPPAFTKDADPGESVRQSNAASSLSVRWAALQDAADAVAMLGGLSNRTPAPEIRNFPARIRDAGGTRLALAQRGVEDLSAVMESGIAALMAVNARGGDAGSPAAALLAEYIRARDAVLSLLPPPGAHGPRRSA